MKGGVGQLEPVLLPPRRYALQPLNRVQVQQKNEVGLEAARDAPVQLANKTQL